MSVKERLKTFIKYKNIPVRRFEEVCDLSFSYVNNIRKSIQPDKVSNIAQQYPDLNTGWLLTGEGEMLKNSNPELSLHEPSPVYEKIDKDELIRELRDRVKFQEGIITELLTKLK
jgi:transcriptional regulator with XRE-family HTH domain